MGSRRVVRDQGMSYPAIARALGVGYGTVVRGVDALSKTQESNAAAKH
jgi:transposase